MRAESGVRVGCSCSASHPPSTINRRTGTDLRRLFRQPTEPHVTHQGGTPLEGRKWLSNASRPGKGERAHRAMLSAVVMGEARSTPLPIVAVGVRDFAHLLALVGLWRPWRTLSPGQGRSIPSRSNSRAAILVKLSRQRATAWIWPPPMPSACLRSKIGLRAC